MHTPGPWYIDKDRPKGLEFDGYFRIRGANHRHVATVPVNTFGGEPEGEGIANAHIVEAAADLLEACEAALRLLGRCDQQAQWPMQWGPHPIDPDKVFPTLSTLRSALAKAKAEASPSRASAD